VGGGGGGGLSKEQFGREVLELVWVRRRRVVDGRVEDLSEFLLPLSEADDDGELLKALFREIDTDNSGVLTRAELVEAVERCKAAGEAAEQKELALALESLLKTGGG